MDNIYTAPEVEDADVTPLLVRDELLKCFESANGEFAKAMAKPINDRELKQQVKGFVENVFSKCGVDYVAPTKEGILVAISECKKNAEGMMGPQGSLIIEHHYSEMMKLVNRL